jgi:molybdenum cofactor synthesis domain-containing protein
MVELNLLGKNELWIIDVILRDVNLSTVAGAVAQVLGLGRDEVLVADARADCIVLDIMREHMNAEQIIGKRAKLLSELSKVRGLTITDETDIHSEGILGFISLDRNVAEKAIEESTKIVQELKEKVAKRCIVYPTGFELIKGYVQDTNTASIVEDLKREGYAVDVGQVLNDDEHSIASKITEAVDSGYGIVILTGGVGAEDKDRTIEGILKIDHSAATPYIIKYQVGNGRHAKDGVRIAVGRVGEATIVALPGPTDEVKLALGPLVKGLSQKLDKHRLANEVAGALRERLRHAMNKSEYGVEMHRAF